MIELIKFELYKIFSKKSFIIIMLLTILFAGRNVYYNVNPKYLGFESLDEIKKIFEPYEGSVIKEEEVSKIYEKREEILKKRRKGEVLTKEENLYFYYLRDYMVDTNPAYMINGQMYKLDEMKKEIDNLEKLGKTDTYEYKNLDYIYNLVNNKETPKFYYKEPWTLATDFNVIATLTSTLVAIGIATLFSEDYQRNSSAIILSSRYGRTKLVTSKILSGIICVVISFVIVNGVYAINIGAIGFEHGNLPLNFFSSFEQTPFNMTMGEFYLTGLSTSFIGLMLYAILIMLISLILKNNMLTLLIGLGMYYIPQFIANFAYDNKVLKLLGELNVAESIRIQGMFKQPITYNILGKPVLYSTIMITLVIIIIHIGLFSIKYFGKRQEV